MQALPLNTHPAHGEGLNLKFNRLTLLIDSGGFTETNAWTRIRKDVRAAVAAVQWPPNSGSFKIYPESDGNGVTPIKSGFIAELRVRGWQPEQRKAKDDQSPAAFRPGAFDAWLDELPIEVVDKERALRACFG